MSEAVLCVGVGLPGLPGLPGVAARPKARGPGLLFDEFPPGSAIDVSPWRVAGNDRASPPRGNPFALGPTPTLGGADDGVRMTTSPPESLSTDCSLGDDLDLDLWEGQFEFVGSNFSGKSGQSPGQDDDDVITPAMVRHARGEADLDSQVDAQQWCDHLTDQVSRRSAARRRHQSAQYIVTCRPVKPLGTPGL